MNQPVLLKTYPQPAFDEKEILRYAGAKVPTDEVTALMRSCLEEVDGALSYKVCYRFFPVRCTEAGVDMTFARWETRDLCRALSGCDRALVFAATVGIGIDRLIAKYQLLSPARAMMFQAIGAERIECLCDEFCADLTDTLRQEGRFCRPRFSPGYGDLPLSAQTALFGVLDCERKLGLTLNDSLLMSPSKSVTAIVGVSSTESAVPHRGCALCENTQCTYRRTT